MDICQRIKELREGKNMSQEELADKIGVTKQMISHYENGLNVPRQGTLKKIVEVFNISLTEFYNKSTSNLTNEPPAEYKTPTIYELQQKIEGLLSEVVAEQRKRISDKDKIIELQDEISKLKDKYERKRA